MCAVVDPIRTGRRIKELMKLYDISAKDIKEYLSLTCVQTVYRWLNGETIPSVDNLYALSVLFHVGLDDIVKGDRKFSPYPYAFADNRSIYRLEGFIFKSA